jgi:hypothetical protein
MSAAQNQQTFDTAVRSQVYRFFAREARSPARAEIAVALEGDEAQVGAAYQRLAEGRALVLQHDGEILVAEPFSAVPTSFVVEMGGRSWWGNCIWDALGIPAMLKEDARIVTTCDDCGDEIALTIEGGELVEKSGRIHFVVPAEHWWNDIVYT